MLEPADVFARLETLMGADLSNRVLGSAQHRYLLTPKWPEDRVKQFEARHKIELPADYRHFIRQIGSAGAGPGYGLFEPGTWDGEPSRWDGSRAVAPLVRAFRHSAKWNLPQHKLAEHLAENDDERLGEQYLSPEIVSGAMPIASLGRGTRLLLVITGAERGRIWLDDRAHENGLGRFSAGPHPHFEQGTELRDAVAIRTPPPGTGDGHLLFVALFERVATGAAVEVPGLFTVWRAAAATWDSYDYLGRRQVAEEPPMLIIADDPNLPRA